MSKPYRTWEVKESKGRWYVWESNPKKGVRSLNVHFKTFGEETAARIYAAMRTDEDMERERQKAQKRQERAKAQKATANPFHVGMIFRNSWGYDQTNVDYYEVVRVTPRGVYIRPIGAKSVVHSGHAHGMADQVVPDKGNFTGPEQFKPVKVHTYGEKPEPYIAAEFGCMRLVDEWEATYRSWYH